MSKIDLINILNSSQKNSRTCSHGIKLMAINLVYEIYSHDFHGYKFENFSVMN